MPSHWPSCRRACVTAPTTGRAGPRRCATPCSRSPAARPSTCASRRTTAWWRASSPSTPGRPAPPTSPSCASSPSTRAARAASSPVSRRSSARCSTTARRMRAARRSARASSTWSTSVATARGTGGCSPSCWARACGPSGTRLRRTPCHSPTWTPAAPCFPRRCAWAARPPLACPAGARRPRARGRRRHGGGGAAAAAAAAAALGPRRSVDRCHVPRHGRPPAPPLRAAPAPAGGGGCHRGLLACRPLPHFSAHERRRQPGRGGAVTEGWRKRSGSLVRGGLSRWGAAAAAAATPGLAER
ncbi:hypothetical protein AAFF_G00037920, partial [Aldrovandia affinis]